MCTFDDHHGVYFSIQALRLYHPLVSRDDVEIIVIDNNPNGKHGEANRNLCNWIKDKVKYIPYTEKQTTANRNLIFQHAQGKYCISMDCHVMLPPTSLEKLLEHYESNPDCKDLVQGPMIYDNLTGYATHFKPTWGGDMYGQWDTDHDKIKKRVPFDIPMMGLGTFSCETKNWLGFNELFTGFGGEEGYIHEKFRKNGGRSLCVPGFKWLHRFGRPDGAPYPLKLEDRIWNYYIGWGELQGPDGKMLEEITDFFKNRIPMPRLNQIRRKAAEAIEKQNSQK